MDLDDFNKWCNSTKTRSSLIGSNIGWMSALAYMVPLTRAAKLVERYERDKRQGLWP